MKTGREVRGRPTLKRGISVFMRSVSPNRCLSYTRIPSISVHFLIPFTTIQIQVWSTLKTTGAGWKTFYFSCETFKDTAACVRVEFACTDVSFIYYMMLAFKISGQGVGDVWEYQHRLDTAAVPTFNHGRKGSNILVLGKFRAVLSLKSSIKNTLYHFLYFILK